MTWLARLAAISAGAMLLATGANAEELCSLAPDSYTAAATTYPYLSSAISAVSNYSIATWYSDRVETTKMVSIVEDMVSTCDEDSRLSIVVYGIPNKDCAGGYSSDGWVSNTDDYKSFLTKLTDAVGDRKVLYVVEPDAVGLLAESGGCGSSSGYLENLKVAIEILSANPNADMYLDVGYWMLSGSNLNNVVNVIKEVVGSGKLKGIALNTSNYRSNKEISNLCGAFQTAYGSKDLHCVIDTSRNYVDPTTTDWCNVLTAGIGLPPRTETGFANLDYFMWIKVPGESDGECNGGPTAGGFFAEAFSKLWNQGYFTAEAGYSAVDASNSNGGQSSSTKPSTPTATTATPTATTATPASTTEAKTDAPGTVAPAGGYDSSSGSEIQGDADSSSSSVEGDAADSSETDVSELTDAPEVTTEAPVATTEAPVETNEAPAETTATPTATQAQCKPKMRKRSRKL